MEGFPVGLWLFYIIISTVIKEPVPHHYQTGLVLQERCGLPVTVKLRASMRYKTFHGLPALKGGALHGCPGERPDPKSGATVGAPVAAQLPDIRAHRYARTTAATESWLGWLDM